MNSKTRWIIVVFALCMAMTLGACKKKAQPAPPAPPPPPPPAPTATLTANPTTIQQGQATTLTWETSNATDVSIEGIGTVQPSGSQEVKPNDSTTYRLIAKGAGGTQEATARVTVTPPPPPPPPPPAATETPEEVFNKNIKDIYFEYDKYDIRPDQTAALQADAEFLKAHTDMGFTIEGHCDERGSTEYNLELGDKRANAVKNALVQAGVNADRIKTISYGKEKPFCTESNEQCWQQNRRGHFAYTK